MVGYVRKKKVKCKNPECNNLVFRGFCTEWKCRKKDENGAILRRAIMYRWNKKNRQLLIEAFGGKCQNTKCLVEGGCKDVRCLQFDHINGDGYKDRKGYKVGWYKYWLEHLEEAKQKFQLLCSNCNWIKKEENNENRRMV